MAKQPSGEGKAPLVISLVFFVLLSIGLGVMLYMAGEDKAILRDEAKKKQEGETAAKKLLEDQQARYLTLKVAMGTNTQEDWDNLKNTRSEVEARKEYDNLVGEIGNKVGTREKPGPLYNAAAKDFVGVQGADFRLSANDVFSWNWPTGAKLEREPTQSMLGAVVNAHARGQLAAAKATGQFKAAQTAEGSMKQGLDDALKQKHELQAAAAKFPPTIADIQKKADEDKAGTRNVFAGKTKDYQEDVRKLTTEKNDREIRIGELEQLVKGLREENRRLEEQLEEVEDPFPFDAPHGRITDRKGSTVTINLGSADKVRPGLTFKIRPADALQPGSQTELVPKLDRTGRPMFKNGKPVMVIPEKGLIEVTMVLGPNSSLARITDNPDPIRKGIMTGDLLFNSAWRKDGADRVALFGIFDVDGDGVDDTRQVVRDLQKMGIIVDAVFDLEQRKWVDPNTGKPATVSPLTTYTIEGYYPPSTGSEAIVGAKAAIDGALRAARTEAKEKGSKVVRMREFFPRIGYKIKLDISTDAINRAYSRYLVTLPPPEAGDAPKN